MPEPTQGSETFRFRSQSFDVVLVKAGVRAHEAKSEDFRRLAVTAIGVQEAEAQEDVAKLVAEGWTVHRVMGRGQVTHEEQAAAARAHAAARPVRTGPLDVDKPDMADRDRHGRRLQTLDVVLSRAGVSTLSAKPDDFRRVPVVASDAVSAREHVDVVKAIAEGWVVSQIVPPGQKTQDEHRAELAAYEGSLEALAPATRRVRG